MNSLNGGFHTYIEGAIKILSEEIDALQQKIDDLDFKITNHKHGEK